MSNLTNLPSLSARKLKINGAIIDDNIVKLTIFCFQCIIKQKDCRNDCFIATAMTTVKSLAFETLRPRKNGRYLADDIFKRIFLN